MHGLATEAEMTETEAPIVTIERQLYLSLRAMPCRCQMVGKAAWHFRPQTVVAKQCSRCAAIERYETEHPEERR